MIRGLSGNQPGDPVRGVKAIVEAVESSDPPFNLMLGKASLKNARIKLDDLKAEFDKWADVSEGADFPETDVAQAK